MPQQRDGWLVQRTGRALDVCTYQGGFALHLAGYGGGGCERVTGVDASRAALEVADRNLELNVALGGISAKVDWVEADAFELLRDFEGAGERFDTVVLDPPAFAKSKRAAEGAIRGYKELNLRALKMLTPGATLVTCSCSHHVGLEEFLGVVRAAAEDAGRRVQVLEMRGAAPDHPAVLTLPETSYLKCLICRVG
jgi:23S rRNA (cytosine1962-C5)-methyltransferase